MTKDEALKKLQDKPGFPDGLLAGKPEDEFAVSTVDKGETIEFFQEEVKRLTRIIEELNRELAQARETDEVRCNYILELKTQLYGE